MISGFNLEHLPVAGAFRCLLSARTEVLPDWQCALPGQPLNQECCRAVGDLFVVNRLYGRKHPRAQFCARARSQFLLNRSGYVSGQSKPARRRWIFLSIYEPLFVY